MTDMLHKPIGWDEPLNQMTEEEWKEKSILQLVQTAGSFIGKQLES